jgi:hypothetical protein
VEQFYFGKVLGTPLHGIFVRVATIRLTGRRVKAECKKSEKRMGRKVQDRRGKEKAAGQRKATGDTHHQ